MSHGSHEPLEVERDETEAERVDRNFTELLGELRIALPGVQVLFAFLLTVPFAQGFTSLTQFERDLYLVVLLETALASALLIAPTAYHRVLFRRGYKPQILTFANRSAIAGLGVLALAMTSAIFLISHIIFGEATSIAVTIPSAMVFALLWYILPWLRAQGAADRQF
ncbi:MAG TPA: DUF6328 family protein [Solirubrobacterales bacterium]|jgi:hypothetical protein|nr:DUF6328 family protein [Solirubrobacterales bacterium]